MSASGLLAADRAPARQPRLAGGRAELERALRGSWKRRLFSPALLGLYSEMLPLIERYAAGAVLDAGCGEMPFREPLSRAGSSYHSLDVERRVPDVEIVADLQDMPEVASEAYDTVLCSEVLEHVARPHRVAAEVFRVLRRGGVFLASVPHLSRLHEEPHDYFRYTRHGLDHLLADAGFEVLEVRPTGSLCSFLGHQLSTLLVCGLWGVPVLGHVAFWVNALCVTVPCQLLDRPGRMRDKLPLGYVIAARKP